MWYTLMAATLAWAAADVNVQTLAGEELSGQLVEVTERQIVLETAQGRKSQPIAGLLSVAPANPRSIENVKPRYWVRLSDGTQLLADAYKVKDRMATIQLCGGGTPLEIPTRSVAWLRLREPDPAVDEQWRAILSQKTAGDLVVIRVSPTALDQLEGVLHDLDENTAQFEFDGDRIPVGLKKLEGLVYYHPLGKDEPRPACKLTTVEGSSWSVRSLVLKEQVLEVTTTGGVRVELPLDRVRLLDFSSGNVVYLSDLEAENMTWTPFMEFPSLAAKLSKLFGPKKDQSLDGGKLKLGNRLYQKGLALHSRSELTYRLTDNYRRFQADFGIDGAVGPSGHVELIIFGDDKELFRGEVSGRDEPGSLDLDIAGVRRLKILVDFGMQLDIADHLNLCNARIIK